MADLVICDGAPDGMVQGFGLDTFLPHLVANHTFPVNSLSSRLYLF